MLVKKNLNKIFTISCCTTLSIILITTITLITTSFWHFTIENVYNKNPYHVSLKTEKDELYKNVDKIKTIKFDKGKTLITYENIYDTYNMTKKIGGKNITYNEDLLGLYLLNDKYYYILKIILIILILICISSFLIIKNAFNVRFSERIKQFGILKSIGMTKKQIRHSIYRETFIISLISLVIGLIISVILTLLLIVLLNSLLNEILTIKFKLYIIPQVLIFIAIGIILLIFISSLNPAIRASKTPPIELIRNNENIKIKKTKKYKNNIIKKIAYYSVKRSKRKYIPLTITIFISITLFTCSSLYLNYILYSTSNLISNPTYDGEIIVQGDGITPLNTYVKNNNIKKYTLFKMCITKIKPSKNLFEKNYSKQKNLIIIKNDKEKIINRVIYTKKENKKILKIDSPYLKRFELDKPIPLTTKVPWGLENLLSKDNIVFLTNHFNKYCSNYQTVLRYKGDTKNIKIDTLKLSKKYKLKISYTDNQKAFELMNKFTLSFNIGLYSILIIVILVGISFIVSIISFSYKMRYDEFKLFLSIGMDNKNLKKMLIYETMFITKKAFILSFFVTLIFDYILYESLKEIVVTPFIFPLKELLMSFILCELIIYLILSFTYKKMNFKKRIL